MFDVYKKLCYKIYQHSANYKNLILNLANFDFLTIYKHNMHLKGMLHLLIRQFSIMYQKTAIFINVT